MSVRGFPSLFACCFVSLSLFAIAQDGPAPKESPTRLERTMSNDLAHLEDLYRHLHSNPELSFAEAATAKRIAAELESAGFTVTMGVGGHGVVGILENGEGPRVLVRTDLDALPITEDTGSPFASKVKVKDASGTEIGVMHACGHDMHMSSFVGTARTLAALKSEWKGTLMFIGQPAEERGSGAKAMLEDKLYERFGRPDMALAFHVSADLPSGKVGYCPGPALASVDSVDISVRGVGGHGAYPHTTKDPVVIAAQIVLALQTLVSREIAPIEPAVVTVGSIHGGSKHNIISDEVKMQLTCRAYSDKVREQILAGIRRIALNIARAAGVPEDRLPIVKVLEESIPATINDPEFTGRVAALAAGIIGPDNVKKLSPVMGGEDFGCFGREEPPVPICMLWLGAVNPDVYTKAKSEGLPLPSLHSPFFLPELRSTLETGVRVMSGVVLELMKPR